MAIETQSFGGNKGNQFDEQFVSSIGFSAGGLVDALILNGQRFGGRGGKEGKVIEMQPDEYINEITIMTGRARIPGRPRKRRSRSVFSISFTTSTGRQLTAGTGRAGKDRSVLTLSGIRVLTIGGNSGSRLDKLRIRYISEYTESERIEKGVNAILGIIPQGQRVETFVSSSVAKLAATERLLETTLSLEQSSEAGAAFGDFSARASTTFGLTVTSRIQLNEQLETKRTETETRTYEPPAGHIGLEVVKVDIFRTDDDDEDDNEGTVWMFPVSEPNVVTVNTSDAPAITENLYDLTGQLELHLSSMAGKKQQQHGFGMFAQSTQPVIDTVKSEVAA